mgnify:CR=1 FL=1
MIWSPSCVGSQDGCKPNLSIPSPKRHEVNCLTKEEFERWSKSPSLARQNSQMLSPLSSSLSFNEVIKAPEAGDNLAGMKDDRTDHENNNRALALMAQPSVDYGKSIYATDFHSLGGQIDSSY